jgi:hypothetical protein
MQIIIPILFQGIYQIIEIKEIKVANEAKNKCFLSKMRSIKI